MEGQQARNRRIFRAYKTSWLCTRHSMQGCASTSEPVVPDLKVCTTFALAADLADVGADPEERVQQAGVLERRRLVGEAPKQEAEHDVAPELAHAVEQRECPVADHADAARQPGGQPRRQVRRHAVEVQLLRPDRQVWAGSHMQVVGTGTQPGPSAGTGALRRQGNRGKPRVSTWEFAMPLNPTAPAQSSGALESYRGSGESSSKHAAKYQLEQQEPCQTGIMCGLTWC